MPRYPVDNRIKNGQQIPFGGADSNAKYGRHSGDDSANGVGTPVYAPASGRVTGYASSQYHGNVVEIQDDKGLFPHIFHLRSRNVQTNQQVAEGQLVGYSGSTGLSTGPHVHFGVAKKSVPSTTSFADFIDPMEYIKQGGDMPLTEDQVYKLIRGITRRDVTQSEASNPKYRDAGFAVDTFWNNGGKEGYDIEKRQPGSLTTGEVALRDKWQSQIETLTKENQELKDGLVEIPGPVYKKK